MEQHKRTIARSGENMINHKINKWSAQDYAFCVNNNLLFDILEEN